jgi:hypothetical protein
MKVVFQEFGQFFHISFEPESMEDQNTLIRFGLNATKEQVYMDSSIGPKSNVSSWIDISKRKRPITSIKA